MTACDPKQPVDLLSTELMLSEEKRDSAIADRLAEAVECYRTLGKSSETLDFAEQRVLEFQRLFNQRDESGLRRSVSQFRGVDDSKYGSVFGLIVKLLAEHLDSTN